MSSHGRSIFQYFNETDEVWIPIPVGDLVSVEYVDKVYSPASAEIIISNRDMNKPLGTDSDAAAGVYSVEGGSITTPTFHRYQQIRLLHMPRPLVPTALVHDSNGTQATFTSNLHGLTVGDYVQIVNDTTGIIPDDLYKVDTVPTTSTFTLDKRGVGTASQTYTTSLPGGGPTATAINNGSGHNDSVTSLTVDSTAGINDGDHIKIGTEIIRVTTVASATVLNPVVREVFGTSAASMADDAVVTKVDVAYLQYRSDHALFPYFYGKIDTLDVSYSDAVGKTIHIEASDYLRSLATEPVTRSFQSSTTATQSFGTSRIERGDPDDTDDAGKFRDVVYDNTKLSDTVSDIMNDWSTGRDLYADNTYDGSTSMGVSKFEASPFVYGANDKEKIKTYKNTNTTALGAMRSVAMTDIHWNYGVTLPTASNGPAEIYYTVAGSTTLSTSGSSRDVLIVFGGTGGSGDIAHLYENGNLIEISEHQVAGTTEDIESGTYIVHSKTTYNLKLKTLDGGLLQRTANTASSASSGTPSKINVIPQGTGNQGSDFYLDAGLYGDVTLTSNTHRPHLNYFPRKTRPISPDTAGLTAVYPTDDNMSEDDTAFGTKGANQTKAFIMQEFDHGLFDEDLFTQVALRAVDSSGVIINENEIGGKMEMLKVNSISNSDYVGKLTSLHYKYSGDRHGNGLFHWNRADDARAYGWYSGLSDINTNDEVNRLNANFFATDADVSSVTNWKGSPDVHATTGRTRLNEFDYASKGTFGVAQAASGSVGEGGAALLSSGMSGFSNLPLGGRKISLSPNGKSNGAKTAEVDNFTARDGTHYPRTATPDDAGARAYSIDMGAESLASANLIKDMYWCEKELLLGTEVTAVHDRSDSAIVVTKTDHGLETGTLIRITNIDDVTSGAVQGVTVNTIPEAPTASNTTTGSRNNGSYFRVERVDVDTFKFTLPQLHKSEYRNAAGTLINPIAFTSSPSGNNVFKYNPVFNVFKDVCRVQWQSGSSWTTKEDDTVLDSSLVKGAQHIVISDVALRDRPYRGLEVNALVAGHALPGFDFTDDSEGYPKHHPVDTYTDGGTEAFSYFGFTTVPFCLEADFLPPGNNTTTTAAVHRYGSDADDDVRVLFRYGDHVSETRFLYGDSDLVGVVGRNRTGASGAADHEDGGADKTSKDVFKTVNCKVLERFATRRNISKTYNLNFNETLESSDAARNAVASILKRVIMPAQRTTFKILGYPSIKLLGQGQGSPDSSGSTLYPAQDFSSYGGKPGMLLEKLDGADGTVTGSTLVEVLHPTTDAAVSPISGNWAVGTYYRAFIHLRAGMSIRVSHTAAGVVGNHIMTGLKYSERGGSATSMISTTGYDEGLINMRHGNLAMAQNAISSTANQGKITVTDAAGYAVKLANIQVEYDDAATATNGPFSHG